MGGLGGRGAPPMPPSRRFIKEVTLPRVQNHTFLPRVHRVNLIALTSETGDAAKVQNARRCLARRLKLLPQRTSWAPTATTASSATGMRRGPKNRAHRRRSHVQTQLTGTSHTARACKQALRGTSHTSSTQRLVLTRTKRT